MSLFSFDPQQTLTAVPGAPRSGRSKARGALTSMADASAEAVQPKLAGSDDEPEVLSEPFNYASLTSKNPLHSMTYAVFRVRTKSTALDPNFSFREALIYSSHRRKPGSSSSIFMDSGVRRNDNFSFNQRFLR